MRAVSYPLPDGRSGAGLYAIEQASRIWRNEHHLAILRAQEERCSTAVSRKSPKAVPLAPACVRHIESALSPQLRRFTLPATRGQQTPPLSSSTFRPSHQERDKTRARSPLQAARSSQEDRHSVGKSTSTSLDRLGSYHMKIVVIGGTGLIGSKLVALLRKRGQEVLAASPDSGVNTLTGEGLAEALGGAQVVVDLTNSPSFEDTAVMKFFETSSRNLLAAEAATGVRHHVALSIVGTDRLPDSGYLRAKMAQERLIKASGIPYTILRSTQFFEFMGRVADSFSDGKTVRVPPALVQPIFSNDVVTALADLVLGAPANDTLEVAGPEKLRFDELIRRVLANNHDARKVTSDVHARYFGTELNDQSLVPASTAPRIGTTRFESWLARSTSQT